MNERIRKLKIDIKGNFQKLWTDFVLKRKAKSLGVNVQFVKHHSLHHGELILVGESDNLWKIIKSIKAPSVLFRMDRIIFEFTD